MCEWRGYVRRHTKYDTGKLTESALPTWKIMVYQVKISMLKPQRVGRFDGTLKPFLFCGIGELE